MDYDDQLSEDLLQRFCPAPFIGLLFTQEKTSSGIAVALNWQFVFISQTSLCHPVGRRADCSPLRLGCPAVHKTGKRGRTVVLPGS